MRFHDSTLVVAPTDIANHLACRHLTQLDRARLAGERIELRQDPRIDALRHRGETHEKGFVDSLAAEGLSITDLRDHDDPAATLDAMTAGADVIVQAPLQGDGLSGRADVLLRIAVPSRLGASSYEPTDTKLARDTRAGTILQLCAYAALLNPMQGLLPEHIHVVTPLARERYRTAHFDAYFRFVRRRLEDDLAADPPPATYPEPVPHCDVCPYWLHCDRHRRADDHLSLGAGIRKLNVRELESQGIRAVDGAWSYEHRWAFASAHERAVCETFLDFVLARLETYPDLHVYHFGVYEPAALKRLVSKHGTRAEALDGLLRGGRFVDLHTVVCQGLRIGVERYGLKELEPLVGFRREHDLRDAALARLAVELALEVGDTDGIDAALRDRVAAYNREDCLSAAALRDWLEARRGESPVPIPRPQAASSEPKETVRERDRRIREAAEALLVGVPEDPSARDAAQQARWLLAQMLGYFRREEKCAWWEHFRLRELPLDELLDEREALAGLQFERELPKASQRQKVAVHRYRFPPQETALDDGDRLRATSGDDDYFGRVERIDLAAGTVDIRKTARTADIHPPAVFREQVVPAGALEDSLRAFADHVATAGLDVDGPYRAASELLCRRPPRPRSGIGAPLRRAGESLVDATVRLCRELDGGVLPIQGPPGSGKTYVGARALVALATGGKRDRETA